jgi:hypothetical protein
VAQEQMFAGLCKGCGEPFFLVEIEGKCCKRNKSGAKNVSAGGTVLA